MSSRNIIHITGPSGAGKSTLLRKIRNKYGDKIAIIDTDIVDDKNALKLLKTPLYKRYVELGDMDKFYERKTELNLNYVTKILKIQKDNGKVFIIVGHSFEGSSDPKHISNYKFCINVDIDDLYKRVYLRTLKDICTNSTSISKLLKSSEHPQVIKLLCLYKFHIRQDFIGDYFTYKVNIEKFYNKMKENGYEILNAADIYKNIVQVVGDANGDANGDVVDNVVEKIENNNH